MSGSKREQGIGRRRRIAAASWIRAFAFGLMLLGVAGVSAAFAQLNDSVPKGVDDVDVKEHLGEPLPLDLSFRDENGREVLLGDYFASGRPVLLTLNYYSCPMLCTVQLNGLVDALKQLDWTPGQEFEIVTVSINPREVPELARAKKQTYLGAYERPAAAAGWHFLVGGLSEIERLAQTVGFEYEYDASTGQYAHAAVAYVITPEGTISRYFYGVSFDPRTLRYSLVEASAGRAGSTLDRILLFCFHYDANRGRYAPAARNIMRAGGLLTMVVVGSWLLTIRTRASRTRPRPNEGEAS